jgi:hypothetical protein
MQLYDKDSTDNLLAAKLSDAPIDGSIYGRKDGAWEAVTGGTTAASQLTNAAISANPTAGPSATEQVLKYDGSLLVWGAPVVASKTVTVISSNYTLQLSDANNIIGATGSMYGITIWDDGYLLIPTGTEVTIVVQNLSSITVGLVGSGSNTLNGTTGTYTISRYVTKLVKVAADTWYID